MIRARGRELRSVLAMALAVSCLVGCRNELLGPRECEYLAERLAKVTSPDQLRNPRVRNQVTEQTNRCLVTPYDKTFVRCLGEVGRVDICEADLFRRQGRPEGRRPR